MATLSCRTCGRVVERPGEVFDRPVRCRECGSVIQPPAVKRRPVHEPDQEDDASEAIPVEEMDRPGRAQAEPRTGLPRFFNATTICGVLGLLGGFGFAGLLVLRDRRMALAELIGLSTFIGAVCCAIGLVLGYFLDLFIELFARPNDGDRS